MEQYKSTPSNKISNNISILDVHESPPPYSQQAIGSDWKHEIIEIKPLNNDLNKHGFAISGGTDTGDGSPIVITHIDYCSKSSLDNGRTKLRLFDRILSINNINLIDITHDEAAEIFSLVQGQSIKLFIYRLNPLNIEHIEFILPKDMSNQSLGIRIEGGIDQNNEDPGLFITYIYPKGLLASITHNNQIRLGDRLLTIKTNYTSANLQWVTQSLALQLIQRICQDHKRVTLIVSHRIS